MGSKKTASVDKNSILYIALDGDINERGGGTPVSMMDMMNGNQQYSQGLNVLLAAIKESLGGKVSEVKLTDRLAEHPVCLTTKGGLSLEMERVLNAAPAGESIKAERVLEINADHEILEVLKAALAEDQEKLDTYARLLYDQALLIEGMPIDDPVRFSTEVCKLMK